MHIEIVVHAPPNHFLFEATVHEFRTPEEFHLDPITFYQKWGKSVPQGIHYEIEILQPLHYLFYRVPLHIHWSRKISTKPLVCWPKHIATKEEALGIFRTWCLGTATTLTLGIDLNTILTECNNDRGLMEQTLKDRHQAMIVRQSSSS